MKTRVAVIGAWHNAFVTAAGLCLYSHEVVLVHPGHDGGTGNGWKGVAHRMYEPQRDPTRPRAAVPALDIHEPGVNDSLDTAFEDGRLRYADSLAEVFMETDEDVETIAWLAIDTALAEHDEPITAPLMDVCERLFAMNVSMLIIGSQVPVGFCESVEAFLKNVARKPVPVACVPENYQLGKGLDTWLHPERIVIGASSKDTHERVEALIGRGSAAFWCNLPTAEMIKHATNAFLATSISFANEMAKVAEAVGADAPTIGRALRADRRIGPKAYVMPGLGFAGGTLGRDLQALTRVWNDREPGLKLTTAVLGMNDEVFEHVARQAKDLGNAICLMGYTYKAETNALRKSPAVAIAKCIGGKTRVFGYDPRFNTMTIQERGERIGYNWFQHCDALAEVRTLAANNPVVYIVVTPLKDFRSIEWKHMGPGVVFDLCGGVIPDHVLEQGLSYKPLWGHLVQP